MSLFLGEDVLTRAYLWIVVINELNLYASGGLGSRSN